MIQLIIAFLFFISILLFLYLRERKFSKIIKEEKEKFKNIFYRSSDGTSILSNGILVDCNDSLVYLLGYENKNQVLYLTPSQLSPEYQPDGQKSLDKSLLMMRIAKEHGVNNFEWIHLRKNGEEFLADITLTNISTDDTKIIIHVIWRDIQRRKEIEEELMELNTTLEEKVDLEVEKNKRQQLVLMQQSRFAQMGEMISMIAHQWRQPLNTLSLVSQGIYMKYKMNKLNDEVMEKFHISSRKQITQMSSTIDDFREFFKSQNEKIIFDISTTIYHVVDIILPIYEKYNIKLEIDIQESIFVNGYSNELGQALINIINNAKDAIFENDAQKIIKIYTVLENDKVFIVIEDRAGGIKPNIINKIFDPYFSTKEEKNGTGLGLYMSKIIIEEHMQGSLSVQNILNGTRFMVELNTTQEA